MSTFPELLARLRAGGESGPFLTWYAEPTADRDAERVELSVATYANWIAKTSSLFVEEFDLERGDYLLVDLPSHWIVPVIAGAAWNIGVGVLTPETSQDAPEPARLRVCGPSGLRTSPDLPTLACSLHPLALRFTSPLPAGVHDFGVEVWSQPDAFQPYDAVAPEDPATATACHGALFSTRSPLPQGARILTQEHPLSAPGLRLWSQVLGAAGSVVLSNGADAARLEELAGIEHATPA